jgi:hypothetical protein
MTGDAAVAEGLYLMDADPLPSHKHSSRRLSGEPQLRHGRMAGLSFEDDLEDAESRARGAVFHHFSPRAGKTKYLVVLNRTWPPADGLVVYAFTTTNIEHFTAARVPEETIVRLNPGR